MILARKSGKSFLEEIREQFYPHSSTSAGRGKFSRYAAVRVRMLTYFNSRPLGLKEVTMQTRPLLLSLTQRSSSLPYVTTAESFWMISGASSVTRSFPGQLRAREGDGGSIHQQMDGASAEVSPVGTSTYERACSQGCGPTSPDSYLLVTRQSSTRKGRRSLRMSYYGGRLRPAVRLRQMGGRLGRQRTPHRPDPVVLCCSFFFLRLFS